MNNPVDSGRLVTVEFTVFFERRVQDWAPPQFVRFTGLGSYGTAVDPPSEPSVDRVVHFGRRHPGAWLRNPVHTVNPENIFDWESIL